MDLFIIGNGFDMAHQLETSYINFRDYLFDDYWEFLSDFEEAYGCSLDMSRSSAEKYLWKDFETNLAALNEDEIIDNATSVDLGLEGGDYYIEDTLDLHWERQYGYIHKLKDYLKLWVESINIDCFIRTDIINKDNDDIFLSFNYTLLLEEVYGIPGEQILHIHGSIDNEYDELVIGHGNSDKIINFRRRASDSREQFDEKQSSICNAIADYCVSTLKEVDSYISINAGFFQRLNNVEQILIIGHSLGDVDLPYFKKIRERANEDALWKIYFYNEYEELTLKDRTISIGVRPEKIIMLRTTIFFNL
nr:bacteriophage abortive infection AbiH family protein [uncultured Trichococcus sp.]